MMKNIIILLLTLNLIILSAHAGNVTSACTYNGIPLYGKVRVVDSFEDFRVRVVSTFEDLRVRPVSSFARNCGQWEFVNSFEDFKIKYVDSFEDFSIRFVDTFEGVR